MTKYIVRMGNWKDTWRLGGALSKEEAQAIISEKKEEGLSNCNLAKMETNTEKTETGFVIKAVKTQDSIHEGDTLYWAEMTTVEDFINEDEGDF